MTTLLKETEEAFNEFKSELSNKIDDVVLPRTRDVIEEAISQAENDIEERNKDLDSLRKLLADYESIAGKCHELISECSDA